MTESPAPLGLRERKKAATRRRIQETALQLFLSKGYDMTTVEEVAAGADISVMTFYRYFPTKESVVEQDEYNPIIAANIRRRPPEEPPLVALHTAFLEALRVIDEQDREVILERLHLVLSTPALRAHLADNQRATQQLFAQALLERGGRQDAPMTLEIYGQAAAFHAVVMAAIGWWVDHGGVDYLPDLVDRASAPLLRSAGH
jgi:AcrR family transcriptional regulator